MRSYFRQGKIWEIQLKFTVCSNLQQHKKKHFPIFFLIWWFSLFNKLKLHFPSAPCSPLPSLKLINMLEEIFHISFSSCCQQKVNCSVDTVCLLTLSSDFQIIVLMLYWPCAALLEPPAGSAVPLQLIQQHIQRFGAENVSWELQKH